MKECKHKRKLNHVLILTSDAADANVKQFRIRAWLAEVIVIMLCILIGGVIGYFIYEGQLWENAGRRSHEQVVAATLEKQSLPTEFPLTSSASMEEVTEGEPMCIFHASVGTTVVAVASGTVMAVNDDETYGHSVWVDHGNGYITIYRNKGDATVAVGDSVVQGTTLFVIGEDNADLGYQMQKDGSYINPMDMLAISG